MAELAGSSQTVAKPIIRYCAIIQQTTKPIAPLVFGQVCVALRTLHEPAGSGHRLLIVFGRRFSVKTPTSMDFHVISHSPFGSLVTQCAFTTSPQYVPKPVLHTVRSSASFFNLQYPVFSWRSSGRCLRILHLLPVTCILSSLFPSIRSCVA